MTDLATTELSGLAWNSYEPQPLKIIFRLNDESGVNGMLTQNNNGRLEFVGDADKSAQCFFHHLIALHDQRMQLLERKLRAARKTLQAIADNPKAADHAERAQGCLEVI